MVEKTFYVEKLKIQDMRKIPNFRTFKHSKIIQSTVLRIPNFSSTFCSTFIRNHGKPEGRPDLTVTDSVYTCAAYIVV